MHPDLKKTLKALSLDLRHLLEGRYDTAGTWRAGDLEQRLNALGVWRDRAPLPADELPHLSEADQQARAVMDAYLTLRREAGIELGDAVAEFVRETAYTWANRLLALRCMEARGLIDEVILQKVVYGGRSLEHHRLAQRRPELCLGEDDGLFAALEAAFARQAEHLPLLFDPRAPGVALRPSAAALKRAVTALSEATGEVFQAADALGWAYQYWNTEEKDRVFEKVRTERGAKISGADIIPATQLYTEPYMVKFLVQNSLGALWMGMHPDSRLYEGWEYYVRDADRAPVERKFLREVTFLDPACGSGHFLLEAFDLFYTMYEEEAHDPGRPLTAAEICAAILQNNLYGIDIDERAVQIAEAALWMKAAEKAFDFRSAPTNLVATNIRLPKGKDHLAAFLTQHPEDRDLRPALEVIFEGLAHADELGSLLQLEEPVEKELRYLQAKMEERRGKLEQAVMFAELEKPKQGELPVGVESYEVWKTRTLMRLKAHFAAEVQAADLRQAFFGRSAERGVRLFDLLARRYDVVTVNPPYVGIRKVGNNLRDHIGKHYLLAVDLYAAFFEACIRLTKGFYALVSPDSYFYLGSFEKLRDLIVKETHIQVVAHTGTYTFDEMRDHVSGAGLVGYIKRTKEGRSLFLDATNERTKADVLLSLCNTEDCRMRYIIENADFLRMPRCTFSYWLSEKIRKVFTEGHYLSEVVNLRHGITTHNNSRYLRFSYEAPLCSGVSKWTRYNKGGTATRWYGLSDYAINWENDGLLLKTEIQSRGWELSYAIYNESYFYMSALSFPHLASLKLGCRFVPSGYIFDIAVSHGFASDDQLMQVLGIINTRLGSYLIKAINPTISIQVGDLEQFPIPTDSPILQDIASISEFCVSTAILTQSEELTSWDFVVSSQDSHWSTEVQSCSLLRALISLLDYRDSIFAIQHAAEGILEYLSHSAYDLSPFDTGQIWSVIEPPAGCYPLISGYDAIPVWQSELNFNNEGMSTYSGLCRELQNHERRTLLSDELMKLKALLRSSYEAGPGAKILNSEGDEQNAASAARIPAETFLEELSVRLATHPISVYWLVKEGREENGWRCLPEERRITADRFTVLILRLLGHRWPKQIEAGEPVPAWADPDGIIPLTGGTAEPTLLDRIRERLPIEFPGGESPTLEREFQELMGESLEAWLGQSFFKHHTSQFKKRPIAWQLQSGRWTSRQKPAFACLIYCHKIDGDTLATLQSQYVRPLRQRYETELRGIESIPANARSARQDARRTELGDLIQELGDFDAALGRVAVEGFASPALEQLIAREPVDRWCSVDGVKAPPEDRAALLRQEQRYLPDLNDGVRVNIAPLQKAGLLAADVLAKKDLDQAIADRAEWRADERRWCREGKLPRPGWWE